MKKTILIFSILVVAGLLMWSTVFLWQNFRGIGPTIRKPSADITELIPYRSPSTPHQNKFGTGQASSGATLPSNNTRMPLTLPPGFSISIFAKGLEKPRVIVNDPGGGLLVSIPSQGRVVSLPDENNDGVADRVVTVVDNLNRPHGMVAHCGDGCTLVIAESHRVARYRYDTTTRKATFETKLFDLPDGGNHFSRTLLALPNDERLAVSVGSSCNVCNEQDWRRAAILVTNQAGTELEPFATGLRNSVFMTIQPETGKLWATDMGRDLIGDDLPPDEINIIEKGDYGWPYCYGKQAHDDSFDPKNEHSCEKTIPSTIDLPAHSAPLGLAFIEGDGWPEEYHGNLLVAFHGSWNRSEPTGYKIVRYPLNENGVAAGEPQDFISGWLQKDGTTLGRPVDLLVEPSGVMYISDDKAGVIYKVWQH